MATYSGMMASAMGALVGVSVLAQLTAAVLSLRLIRVSGWRLPWFLLAAAFMLMAVRRGITLYRILSGDVARPPDPVAEGVALAIAALALVAVVQINKVLEDLQRADQELRVERAFLAQLIEHAPEAIVVLANDGRLLRANSEFTRLFGYSLEEARDRSIDDLLSQGRLRDEARALTDQIASGRTVAVETVRHRKDGTPVQVSIIGTPITFEGGQVAVYGIYRDITPRKQAAEALRDKEARLRLIVEQIPAILWTTDRELRFTSTVGSGLVALGLEPNDVVGKTLLEFFQTSDPEFKPIEIHRRALEGTPGSGELEWGGKVYEAHVQPLHDADGAVVGCVGVALDITDKRILEAQLRQAQKMEAVGQLTGGIAHDFNNLLTVIMANAEIVARMLPSDRAEARADLDELLAAGRRGRTLVTKLLGFGRRSALELQEVDLGELLEDLTQVLSRVLPEDLEIRVSAPRGVGAVRADAGAVEQIVLNLVTNARDAMPQGGVLEIGVERRRLDEAYAASHPGSVPGRYVCLWVRDSGTGMDVHTLQRIFEPFFTTKPPDVGTGLGMATVYGLVKQHQGFVNVTSLLGRGTTVETYFPLVPETVVRARRRATPTEMSEGTETILVVDDEESVRRVTSRMLEQHGYEVHAAADGQEALDIVRRRGNGIDLVVTDLVMPRMGGLELREALVKEGWPGKVLLTSGYVGRRSGTTRVDPGVPFLHKPWTARELLQQVRRALDQPAGD